MQHRPPALARAEREELLREQALLQDLTALLRACPDFGAAPLFDTALAVQDGLCGGRLHEAGQ